MSRIGDSTIMTNQDQCDRERCANVDPQSQEQLWSTAIVVFGASVPTIAETYADVYSDVMRWH